MLNIFRRRKIESDLTPTPLRHWIWHDGETVALDGYEITIQRTGQHFTVKSGWHGQTLHGMFTLHESMDKAKEWANEIDLWNRMRSDGEPNARAKTFLD